MTKDDGNNQDSLKPNEILIAEFEYSSNVTLQSNEEFSRVTNLYLVALGSVVVGILGLNTDNFNIDYLNRGLSLIAGFFSLFSLLIIAQLARVRFTWFDSIEAMKKIKEYYLEEHPELNQAFHWNDLPKKSRLGNSSSLWAIFISIIGSVTAMFSVFFASISDENREFLPGIIAGVIFLIVQIIVYIIGLRDKKSTVENSR
ncbi:MAG: hypothetical protein FVQ83_06355 [Chloroflexi bacterium]|nr:hypothetical protein [Chloroflexota bacterium]